MSLTIALEHNNKSELIALSKMLNRGNEEKIFQQYENNQPQDVFYINCGINEERVIVIWYDKEDEKFRLSTEDRKGLAEFYPHVMAKDVTETVDVKLTITKNRYDR